MNPNSDECRVTCGEPGKPAELPPVHPQCKFLTPQQMMRFITRLMRAKDLLLLRKVSIVAHAAGGPEPIKVHAVLEIKISQGGAL